MKEQKNSKIPYVQKNKKINKKVLLIEDDESLTMALKDSLKRCGLKVVVANSGLDAFEKAFREQPDAIILDLMLPFKHGFEVLKELKASTATKDMPVLILSNLDEQSDIATGMKLGAEDYLVKANFTLSDIIKKVMSFMGC